MLPNNRVIDIETTSRPMEALVRIAEQLTSSVNISEILKAIFSEALSFTEADGGVLSLYHEAEGAFKTRFERGENPPRHLTNAIEREILKTKQSTIQSWGQIHSGINSVFAVPISFEGSVVGLICLYSYTADHFNRTSLDFVSTLANLAQAAIFNAQLYQDTLKRERFYAALGRITMAVNATVNLPKILSLICKEVVQLFDVDGAYIWQKQGNKLIGIAAEGHNSAGIIGGEMDDSDNYIFAAIVARQGFGTFCNHFTRDQKYAKNYAWYQDVKAILAVPLRKDEEVVSILELVDTSRPARFSMPDVEQTTYFGAQAAIAIQNAQLLTEMRELNEQLDTRVVERTQALGQERDRVKYLLRVTSELAATLDQDRVLIRALELVNEIANATHGSILLVDSSTGDLIYPSAFETHKLPPLPRVDLGLKPEEGLAGKVIASRSAMIIEDSWIDERWTPPSDSPDLRSVMAVPLIANDEVIGVLTLFHRVPGAFSTQLLELVEAAALQVANAISNAQLYILIRDQAERLGSMLREEHIEAAKNQSILESIADGVLVTDAHGSVILANHSASQILDIPRDQLIGKSVNELLGLYAAMGKNWTRTIEAWANSNQREIHHVYLAEQLTIEDKHVSVHLSPVFADSQFFGTVSIFRDVTQDVAVDRMKSEFVSTVSHELRTPMTSIKGYAELMLMGAAGGLTDPQKQYLEVIVGNADRMSELINDLLDISRIESGKTTLELQSVNLAQIIESVVEEHLHGLIEHDGKPMIIENEVPLSLPAVFADPDRVTQVLTNLVDNAFHYTPENGRISVRAWPNAEHVCVSVSDTGIGISREHQEKIFERFYRVEDKEIQQVPGTGLGLAIVRSLVQMHGGDILVESTPGVGSTFTFTLPFSTEEKKKTQKVEST